MSGAFFFQSEKKMIFFFQILKKMKFFSNPEKIAISLSFALYRIISTMSQDADRRQRMPRGAGRPFLQRVMRRIAWRRVLRVLWEVLRVLAALMVIWMWALDIWSFFRSYST
jgi:hypothetical protein